MSEEASGLNQDNILCHPRQGRQTLPAAPILMDNDLTAGVLVYRV